MKSANIFLYLRFLNREPEDRQKRYKSKIFLELFKKTYHDFIKSQPGKKSWMERTYKIAAKKLENSKLQLV